MPEDTIDVLMPDGTLVTGVPKSVTQSEVMARYGRMRGAPSPPPTSIAGEIGAGGLEGTIGAPSISEAASQFGQGAKFMARRPIESAGLLAGGAVKAHEEATDIGLRKMHEPGVSSKIIGGVQWLASGVPLLGPALVTTGEEMARGDISIPRGVGRSIGLGATTAFGARGAQLAREVPPPPPKGLGRTSVRVAGVRLPQAAGEASGSAFWNKVRGLLEGSAVGEPLKRLSQSQQKAVNFALGRIARRVGRHLDEGRYEMPAEAFTGSADAMRTKAGGLYQEISSVTSEMAPGASERVAALPGPQRARYLRYQMKSKELAGTVGELLNDLDIREMLTLDPEVSTAIRSRLANLQSADRVAVPFETFQSTRTSLMVLNRKATRAGNFRASRLLSEAIDSVDTTAELMLKAIDAERGTVLAKEWRAANNLWKRAALADDLAEAIDSATTGARPSTQTAAGMKPVPPKVSAPKLLSNLRGLKERIENVYGAEAYTQLETLGEVLRRGQQASPSNLAGHFMTLQAVMIGLSAPAGAVTGFMKGGIPGAAMGAVVGPGMLLGGELALGRMLATALAKPSGRAAFIHLMRTRAGSAAAAMGATRVVAAAAEGGEEAGAAREKQVAPSAEAQRLSRDLSTGRATKTDAMLTAKNGDVTPNELNRVLREQKKRKRPSLALPSSPITPPPPPM